jgi:cytochrome c556
MARTIGGEVAPFIELALQFYKAGEGVAAAAKAKDSKKVLAALEVTLAACNACHASYKQVIVAGPAPK